MTTDYLCFSEPYALDKLATLSNIELKMYHVNDAGVGFHTKGYLFRENGIYRIIIGSSNMTQTALSTNMEWNTQLVSTEQGEMAQSIVSEFERPLMSIPKIIKRQNAVAQLTDNPMMRDSVREALTGVNDIERLMTRVVYGTANAKELKSLQYTIERPFFGVASKSAQ